MNRESIIAAGKRVVTPVEAPGLGGQVFMRCLTGAELNAIPVDIAESSFSYAVAAATMCDESGERLSPPVTAADLLDLAFAAVSPLINAALTMNRMTKDSVDEARKD
jgi:hypothetical protein